jgi:NAD(P)-dependent dehydrogenase (short-subunit alcohol dehydrogenase family)
MSRSAEQDSGVVVPNKWYDDWIKDIPDLTDKVAIVTGSNSGTGFWAANALASKGCSVVMACRSVEKANHAKDEILATYPDAKLDVIVMDGMDFSSVRSFSETFHSKYSRLDYLLNNAGVMAQPLIKSKDGFDIQLQTNHLSHFLLTKLMWDKLVNSPGQSRVVNHSSSAHYAFGAKFDRNRLDNPPYAWGPLGFNVFVVNVALPLFGLTQMDSWLRYGVSKLANVLMMQTLQRKIADQGLTDKVICLACHPGYANTGLQAGATDSMPGWKKLNQSFSQSAADGSLPLLYAAIGTDVQNGEYFGPKNGGKGPPTKDKVKGYGNDLDMATDLWSYSEECVGETF